ncbi:NAD-dependent epimerase/dehydratase family protein [Lyngbya aestuarii]|uniref:NAD-dependent epimerase/dehydratase family protein n=1 Tax=Lyngbya aestuarii TaxID=118322 RepID=UPI00403E296C
MGIILVTGAAGFIGFHLCQKLLARGESVVGIDNLNDYYDVNLKQARLAQLENQSNFEFAKLDLANRDGMASLFAEHQPEKVAHLAAQAGVRYSLKNPYAYSDSNLIGFVNILEGCRHSGVKHLVFASSSSVYGANTKIPFSVEDFVDHPVSLYAATKKANELMAHAYSHLYNLPTTGLRFFTVYGPWGRPDMAYFLFTRAILAGQPIQVFNHGKMQRDFTYIDDIVEGVVRVLDRIPTSNPDSPPNSPEANSNTTKAPYKIYNIGNNQPVPLLEFIEVLEKCLGKEAQKNLLPMQPGDVPITYADITELELETGFKPTTSIETGIAQFVKWYLSYYQK